MVKFYKDTKKLKRDRRRVYRTTWALLIAIGFVLSSCASGPSYVNKVSYQVKSMVGHKLSDLLDTFGPPVKVIPLGDGNRIFSYVFVRRYYYPSTCMGYSYYFGASDCFPPSYEEHKYYANFYVNKDDRVYKSVFSKTPF